MRLNKETETKTVCFRFCLLSSKPVCEENSTITQITPPEIWKRDAVLFGIYSGSSNTKISERFGVNLKTGQKILKELDEPNSDYETMAARKLH